MFYILTAQVLSVRIRVGCEPGQIPDNLLAYDRLQVISRDRRLPRVNPHHQVIRLDTRDDLG